MQQNIIINGAYENNLKHIDLEIPKYKLVVLTGPSGSGKSTLAMDTLQRECQRQYMESMGMTTDAINKPKVQSMLGLSPSISVGQHVTNKNPRSTVGTVTEMYNYLRVLYAKVGEFPCPHCGKKASPVLQDDIKLAVHEDSGFASTFCCPHCQQDIPTFTMSHFSFNNPEGACQTCSGLGHVANLNIKAVFDEEKSIQNGGILSWYESIITYYGNILIAGAKHYGFDFDLTTPIKDFNEIQRDFLYYGTESEEFMRHFPNTKPPKTVGKGKFEGILTGLWRRYKEKEGDSTLSNIFIQELCPDCQGAKLKKESLGVMVGNASIAEITKWPLEELLQWISTLEDGLSKKGKQILQLVLNDLPTKIQRVIDVGLGYLSLDRQAITLSGGEAQRLRLASLLGSGLTGVLYILDEPSSGLHAKDTASLINILKQLRDLGNTVLVIEHDTEMMRAADHIIDIGPGAGALGGRVVGEGTLEDLLTSKDSITGAYLRNNASYIQKHPRRKGNGKVITIAGAQARNLKNVTTSFPLGSLISVTGVSGSGKSTLVFDLLAKAINQDINLEGCSAITGCEHIGNLITVDQSPIGRMKRSNVATYTDVFTSLRNLFATLPAAKERKLTSKDFSFNTAGGRCEHCQGMGVVSLFMHFLPEIEVQCPECKGRRFKEAVLEVTYKGYSISDLLDMSIAESFPILEEEKKVSRIIALLCEVGLGYLHWGQSVTTLSGGEGQRIKLAKELSKKTKKHTLYLLDEPSTGLHPNDVQQLLILLNKLVDAGNTVVLVEHNLDLVREADWVIDIGPDGGTKGGSIVAEGTPEEVASVQASHTGRFLRQALS